MGDLLNMLDKTDFYKAPASTRYHESYEGGLVEHVLHVYDFLTSEPLTAKYSLETLTIVALLHDICKIGMYKTEMRNSKNEQGKWVKVPYYTIDDPFPYGHGEKSVLMIQDFMTLDVEEMMAIRWHMGAYSGQQDWNTLAKASGMFPLVILLQQADMKATYMKDFTL